MRLLILLFAALTLFTACGKKQVDETALTVHHLTSPAPENSSLPNLFADKNGKLYLSWVENIDTTGHALFFSVNENGAWSPPQKIAEGNDWFVNWADFPMMTVFGKNSLAAHFLAKSGEDTYAYDVNLTISNDGGKTWSAPIIPHNDSTDTEHGFVSMLPYSNEQLFVMWLDGRNFAQAESGHDSHGHGSSDAEMTLRYAILDNSGSIVNDGEIDNRVCDCCQTDAVLTSNGILAAYRDRSPEEVRDISFATFESGIWSSPRTLYDDNWEINGCPVNGPAIAAHDNRVAAAWFTMADDSAKVKFIASEDGGKTFGAPIRIDNGNPLGRTDVVLLDNGEALACWIEQVDEEAEILVRKISADGVAGPAITVSKTAASRASGFPKMARRGDEIYIAWTKTDKPTRVRLAKFQMQ